DIDGRNKRQIFTHDQPGVLIQSLSWSPDGTSLAYTYTAPVLGGDGRYLGTTKEVQQIILAAGARSVLVPEAQDPSFSALGGPTPLAYVKISPDTFEPSLWLAAKDGQ